MATEPEPLFVLQLPQKPDMKLSELPANTLFVSIEENEKAVQALIDWHIRGSMLEAIEKDPEWKKAIT